ncbi:MAG: hypothetical protein ACFCUT_03120 [Kiloniellaceae bacterium]
MKLAAWIVIALSLLPLPLAAQTTEGTGGSSSVETTDGQQVLREEVLTAFTRLVGHGETRQRFGLPETTFWRRSSDLEVALFTDDVEAVKWQLERAAAPFASVSGLAIPVVETGPVPAPGWELAGLAPEADLVIIVGSRQRMAEIAAADAFGQGMLARFEMGTWPFMFSFAQDHRRRGIVLLADDEPVRAREASFILATVWGLGGYALGPELTGLIGDPAAGPSLTPLGQAVFRLFFHENLEVGMPLADAVQRAATLLPQ